MSNSDKSSHRTQDLFWRELAKKKLFTFWHSCQPHLISLVHLHLYIWGCCPNGIYYEKKFTSILIVNMVYTFNINFFRTFGFGLIGNIHFHVLTSRFQMRCVNLYSQNIFVGNNVWKKHGLCKSIRVILSCVFNYKYIILYFVIRHVFMSKYLKWNESAINWVTKVRNE